MEKTFAHAIYGTVFRKHDRCLQGFPGAAARLAVTNQAVIFTIYFSGIDDNSAVMTQNTKEQTLFVVFGASVSDSFDIYADFVCIYNFRLVSLQNITLANRSPQFISNCCPIHALFSLVAICFVAKLIGLHLGVILYTLYKMKWVSFRSRAQTSQLMLFFKSDMEYCY